jgi:hypothetical protein
VNEYQFPSWRRLTFLAVLLIILILALAPSVTKGNINVRVYALLPQGIVRHLYTSFTGVQLHTAGLPESTGWVTVNQKTIQPSIDMIPGSNQLPRQVVTTSITSGRYDSVRMTFSNSTLILTTGQQTSIPTGPQLNANATIQIPPNGNGDVLLILSIDYTLLIATTPSISAAITQVNSY